MFKFPFPSTDLPKACTADVISIRGEDAESEAEASAIRECCDSYFQQFCSGTDCPACSRKLTGALGSFAWGLEYGEGVCSNCGWPCRGKHSPERGGKPIFLQPLPIVLAYHPTQVIKKGAIPCDCSTCPAQAES